MRRTIFRVLLCVAGGVVTSVSVAWGCAAHWDLTWLRHSIIGESSTYRSAMTGESGWDVNHDQAFGYDRLFVTPVDSDPHPPPQGVLLALAAAPEPESRNAPSWSLAAGPIADWVGEEYAAGWPFRCVAGRWSIPPPGPSNWSKHHLLEVGPPMTIWGGRARRGVFLPYRPVWPGLIANTVVFGSALWVVLLMPGMFIRRRRRRAGRCVKCSYDLHNNESSACPECGMPFDSTFLPGSHTKS